MIPPAARRMLTHWWSYGTQVSTELAMILRLVRYFITFFLVFFCFWGLSTVVVDIWWMYRTVWHGEKHVRSDGGFQASTIMKTIVLGVLGFFIPRLLWHLFMEGGEWPRPLTETTSSPPSSSTHPPSVSRTNASSQEWIQRYERILNDLGQWASDHIALRPDRYESLIASTRRQLNRVAQNVSTEASLTSKKNRPARVMVFGRPDVGKSEMWNALMDVEVVSERILHAGTSGTCVTKLSVDVKGSNGIELDVHKMPDIGTAADGQKETLSLSSSGSMVLDPSEGLSVDFISRHFILPDLILYVCKGTELSSCLPKDIAWLKVFKLWLVDFDIPIEVVISHTDSIYPADLKLAEEYDHEKHHSITRLEGLVRNFFSTPNQTFSLRNVIAANFKVYRKPSSDGSSTIIPNRDYRYNLPELHKSLHALKCRDVTTYQPKTDTFFAHHFVQLASRIAKIASTQDLSLYTKCQLQAFVVTTIALEFSTPTTKTHSQSTMDTSDPVSFADGFKQFWLTLGLQNITYDSLKAVAEQLLRQIPVFGDVAFESVVATGLAFGLENLIERLGKAAIAYFIQRRPDDEVRRVFRGDIE